MKIIIITGPSGTGKTSLAKKLLENLDNSYIISTDDFYKTGILSNFLSNLFNSYFDRKISHNSKLLKKTITKIIKNKEINYSYKYDFIKKRTEIISEEPVHIKTLIIEGIFTLELLDFFARSDYLLIKLKINKNICMKRICKRDLAERGKNNEKSIESFHKAWNIYNRKEKYYKKSKKAKELILKKDPNIKTIIKYFAKEYS